MEARSISPADLPYWGADLCPEDRPGVPREAPPHLLRGTHWIEPAQQPIEGPVLTRPGLARPTPVFSTALPPKGVTGALRRLAYMVPDHRVPRWVLLFLADRVDALQGLPAWLRGQRARGGKPRSPAPKHR